MLFFSATLSSLLVVAIASTHAQDPTQKCTVTFGLTKCFKTQNLNDIGNPFIEYLPGTVLDLACTKSAIPVPGQIWFSVSDQCYVFADHVDCMVTGGEDINAFCDVASGPAPKPTSQSTSDESSGSSRSRKISSLLLTVLLGFWFASSVYASSSSTEKEIQDCTTISGIAKCFKTPNTNDLNNHFIQYPLGAVLTVSCVDPAVGQWWFSEHDQCYVPAALLYCEANGGESLDAFCSGQASSQTSDSPSGSSRSVIYSFPFFSLVLSLWFGVTAFATFASAKDQNRETCWPDEETECIISGKTIIRYMPGDHFEKKCSTGTLLGTGTDWIYTYDECYVRAGWSGCPKNIHGNDVRCLYNETNLGYPLDNLNGIPMLPSDTQEQESDCCGATSGSSTRRSDFTSTFLFTAFLSLWLAIGALATPALSKLDEPLECQSTEDQYCVDNVIFTQDSNSPIASGEVVPISCKWISQNLGTWVLHAQRLCFVDITKIACEEDDALDNLQECTTSSMHEPDTSSSATKVGLLATTRILRSVVALSLIVGAGGWLCMIVLN
ncbi:hypothetical protein EJ05DRAFT_334782 [Pseudovirgaria hyperparasitica]|uniref:Uncharacterized protein n=1 Tax=Pseudovirgaria hyperparasitica TaxID=470096 RepID=A0A6A6WBD9_9PEZI|nr:uncharacterized protein EJ05DRAFT_334782 [Pseudovirgaria hyperparasitica]KAF2759156.1 hypothetical protein EJ05DRAFT_334782 [Pseudovirgaria hyperparasitica]